jgi:uncharacterized repeat protein (TIGR03803 family)
MRALHFVRLSKPNRRSSACAVLLFALCATTAISSSAQTFTVLHSFDGTDGAGPEKGLVQGRNGNLYGTASYDGPDATNGSGGTVFEMTPSGALATLYGFCSQSDCADGDNPYATLVQATEGNFYGTTFGGGANGHGTVFKITPGGALTTLYSFCSQSGCTDGAQPVAGLVQGTDGNFYGTTFQGATKNAGTIFKITPGGALTTLHSFCSKGGCSDGATPNAGLVQGTDGNFYGTTAQGGTKYAGTIFKITPSGTLTTLHNFCSQSLCTDGEDPYAGLTQATDGNFYGTTYQGGANSVGTVFRITPRGTLTTLYSFCSQSGCTDGWGPYTTLVQGTDGNFYGTTYSGAFPPETVFKITPSGTLTTLHTFCQQSACTDGTFPVAELFLDTNGNLYGATEGGGTHNYGTVFSLSVGLSPFAITQPASGKVGKVVEILGTDLTGATSVSFNGTAAPFTVVSNSFITTTVPTSASTGFVTVTTPSATLTSNKKFRVEP